MPKYSLATLASALVVAGVGCGTDLEPGGGDSVELWGSLSPGWSALSPPPLVRARAVSVWTGKELIYWGGDTNLKGTHHADGAAFDPVSQTWRNLPSTPLSGRSSAGAVWTGTEVIIWGGWARAPKGDGAAFDPTNGDWRVLPPSPLSPRHPVAAVWTGREMLVWGDASRAAAARDGAAYDPAADLWRRLPLSPLALNTASAIWTGKEMVVYGAHLDGNNWSEKRHAQGIAYDPDANAWRTISDYPFSPQASSAAWTGEEVLVWDYELEAAAYDPRRDAWRTIPDLPLRFGECYPKSVRVEQTILGWFCGLGAIFDIHTSSWEPIPPAPSEIFGVPVAAGGVVLFAGAAHEGVANALWAFVPTR